MRPATSRAAARALALWGSAALVGALPAAAGLEAAFEVRVIGQPRGLENRDYPVIGQDVAFDARASDGNPDDWCWRIGEGPASRCDSRDRIERRAFDEPGPVRVELEVRRDEGVSLSFDTTDPCPSPELDDLSCTRSITVCDFRVKSETTDFGSSGGEGTVRVSAPAGCPWEARSSDDSMLQIAPETADGAGQGVVGFTVAPLLGDRGARSTEILVGREGLLEAAVEIGQDQDCFISHGRCISGELRRLPILERRPEGREIPMSWFLIRYRGDPARKAPPVLFLGDGPGLSGIEEAAEIPLELLRSVREVSDLVLPDLRGTGSSNNVFCFGLFEWPLDRPESPSEELEIQSDLSEGCIELRAKKGDTEDVAAYNTLESVADLEALRQVLVEEDLSADGRITFWAKGYGAQLAFSYLRSEFGEHVESLVLHGPRGPDQTFASPAGVQGVLETIAADLESAQPGSDLIGDLSDALDRFDGGVEEDGVRMGRFDLQQSVAELLGSRQGMRELPLRLRQIEEEDFSWAATSAQERRQARPLGPVPFFTANCASLSEARLEQLVTEGSESANLLGAVVDFPLPGLCPAWPVEDERRRYESRLTTPLRAVRTLIVAGSLDASTPLESVKRLRKELRKDKLFRVIGGTHQDLFENRRIRKRVVVFLQEGPCSGRACRKVVLPKLFGE